MRETPTYFLYGELEDTLGPGSLHCETIAARSGRHHWVIRPHRHAHFQQLLHMDEGSGEVSIAGERLLLAAPCAVLIPPQTVHGFRFSRDVGGHVITLLQDRLPSLLVDAPDVRVFLEQPRVIPLTEAGHAAAVCREHVAMLAREYDSRGVGRLALMEAHLLVTLVWLHRVEGTAAVNAVRGRAERIAQQFCALVDTHYRQHKPLAFYAHRLGITPTHLNRIARAVLGESALGVIHRRLLLQAQRELTFSTRSVAQIAESLGFRDAAYFTRFFTRAEGVAPRTFRTRANARP